MTATTPEAPTTDERIQSRLAALTKQRAAIPDDGQLPTSTTRDEAAALAEKRATLDRRIAAIHSAVEQAALVSVSLEVDTRWRDFLTASRDTCSAELLTIKSPIRDRALKERFDDLVFSIKLIDFGFRIALMGVANLAGTRIGDLMQAAGYAIEGPELQGVRGWLGSLPEVEKRITQRTKQQADAQVGLDAALLDDDTRAKREAESQAHRDALNAMHIAHSDDGESLVAYKDDGSVLDLSAMTPIQRQAFEKMDALHRRR